MIEDSSRGMAPPSRDCDTSDGTAGPGTDLADPEASKNTVGKEVPGLGKHGLLGRSRPGFQLSWDLEKDTSLGRHSPPSSTQLVLETWRRRGNEAETWSRKLGVTWVWNTPEFVDIAQRRA